MKSSEINYPILITFISVHCLTVFSLGCSPYLPHYLVWAAAMVFLRWLGFTCAAHRYFAHRVCRTSRVFQFVLGIWATLTMTRSPIRFASGHRHHHLYSDRKGDLHSPKQHGLFGSYIGWVINKRYHEDTLGRVGDLKRYPELIWLNRYYFVPNIILLWALFQYGGLPMFTYAGLLSVVITWHLAFSVTVLFHRVGSAAYQTGDDSKNSMVLALVTCGEGWHNNHHANARSCRLGHEWWQIDLGYIVFMALEALGLVWSINKSVGSAHLGIRSVVRESDLGSGRDYDGELLDRGTTISGVGELPPGFRLPAMMFIT